MIKSTYLTVEASSLLSLSFSLFLSLSLFTGSVIMQCSACVPNGQLRRDCRHEAECAFSFGVGSDASTL